MPFLPVYDINPLKQVSRPYVTWSLIAANVLVFLALGVSQQVVFEYGFIPAQLAGVPLPTEFGGLGAIERLFTYQFIHGGLGHIFGNMLMLFILGDNVEDALGHWRFLGFYVAAGVAAALAEVFIGLSPETPRVGASGAVYGVMAGYLLLFPNAKIAVVPPYVLFFWLFTQRITWELPAFVVILIYIAVDLFSGLSALQAQAASGVANWAHLGGAAAGAVLVLLLRREGRFREAPEVTSHGRQVFDRERLRRYEQRQPASSGPAPVVQEGRARSPHLVKQIGGLGWMFLAAGLLWLLAGLGAVFLGR